MILKEPCPLFAGSVTEWERKEETIRIFGPGITITGMSLDAGPFKHDLGPPRRAPRDCQAHRCRQGD